MKHKLEQIQLLPVTLDDAWTFFSSPGNLNLITPEYMNFRIISGGDVRMFQGQLITYKLRLRGIPYRWVTEITEVRDKQMFVDEQKVGPFSYWRHEHWFRSVPGGVEMRDFLQYEVPFGPIGLLANSVFVGREVRGIFNYRQQVLESIFPRRNPSIR